MGGNGDFGGIDFSKLGGGGEGAPDLGGLGSAINPDEIGEEDDGSDDDMPGLEGDDAKKGEAAPKA